MPSPIRQLLSQTSYDADGTTTVWDFSFASGYLDKSHVKAFYLDSNGVRVPVPVTLGMFIGDYQLSITPALAVGNELTIYRDTPKDAPLVNFADKAVVTEVALDLMATQAVFVAAEASDGLATAITSVAEIAAQVALAADFAANSAASAVAAAASASSIGAAEANAAASAAAALASKLAAAASEAAAAASAVAADADAIAVAADRVQTGLDKVATAADRVQTAADRVQTAADRVQTGLDRTAAATSASTASTQASNAATSATAANTSASNAATSATNAAASAASTNLPTSLTGKALSFLRVKADESGYEHRVAIQLAQDIGVPGRNKLINGNFGINQRAYVSGAGTSAGQYTLDRWKVTATGGITLSTTNNVTVVTIPSGQTLQQVIEGLSLQSGTHVLSWVGTAQGRINGGAYGTSGSVTSAAVGGTNMTVEFGPGTVSLAQLEKGSLASQFEQRLIPIEQFLCMRYYEINDATFYGPAGVNYFPVQYVVPKRVAPTVTRVGNGNVTGATVGTIVESVTSLMFYMTNYAVVGGLFTSDAEIY